MKKRVLAAMSGGVDSSVAAALLVEAGYEVIGVTMKIWPKSECGSQRERSCCSLEAIAYARSVAETLKIPFYVLDFHKEFRDDVIEYFCAEYMKGFTPNPCVLCNEKIKFGKLIHRARQLDARYVATGHFAVNEYDKKRKRFILKEGRDGEKDQSYFLFSLSQAQLGQILMPLGGMTKKEVREIAKKRNLMTFNRPSSQDVCFADDKGYYEVLKKKAKNKIGPGRILSEDGKILGEHKGYPFYTIGQRHGLGVAHKEPLYVIKIDAGKNELVVGPSERVRRRKFVAEDFNLISVKDFKGSRRVKVKIRYNHKKSPAIIKKVSGKKIEVEFDNPQNAITPGQAAVFYEKDVVLGGGWIREVVE
jgi:tRNA-specific 2-thiouridylase